MKRKSPHGGMQQRSIRIPHGDARHAMTKHAISRHGIHEGRGNTVKKVQAFRLRDHGLQMRARIEKLETVCTSFSIVVSVRSFVQIHRSCADRKGSCAYARGFERRSRRSLPQAVLDLEQDYRRHVRNGHFRMLRERQSCFMEAIVCDMEKIRACILSDTRIQ